MSTRFIAGQLAGLTSVMTDTLFSNEYNDTEKNRTNLNVPEVFFCELQRYPHADFQGIPISRSSSITSGYRARKMCMFVLSGQCILPTGVGGRRV